MIRALGSRVVGFLSQMSFGFFLGFARTGALYAGVSLTEIDNGVTEIWIDHEIHRGMKELDRFLDAVPDRRPG